MGRKVTCQICKNKGDSDVFYKVTSDKGLNKYYCNREEYEKRENKKIERYELLKYIAEEILEYEDKQIVPPSMVKRVEKLNEFYPYKVIKDVFNLNKDNIRYWIGVKEDFNEYQMASYIMVIIEKNINDIYKKWKREQEQVARMESKSVIEFAFNNLNGINVQEQLKPKNKSNNISVFLDEDDL